MNKNEITVNETYAALKNFNLAEVMQDELSGLTCSFERIKIPAGGTTVFEIPGENPDESETVKEFSAVILYHHPLHAYYTDKYTGGSNPPDCGSFDGINGEGEPGGDCKSCPYNKFGSGENGSKACKNRRRIYLLREGEIFPMLISLPTGSLKGFTKYLMKLISKGKNSNGVVTRFALRKATNKSGIAYSQAYFTVDRDLTDEEYTLISMLTEQVKQYSLNVGHDNDNSDETIPDNIDPETGEIIRPL